MSRCNAPERVRVRTPVVPTVQSPTTQPPSTPSVQSPSVPQKTNTSQSSTMSRLITLLGATTLGGGNLYLLTKQGPVVNEKWGIQISTGANYNVLGNAIAQDSKGNCAAVGQYEKSANFTTTGLSAKPYLLYSVANRGGYVVKLNAATGRLSWIVDLNTNDTNSEDISADHVCFSEEKDVFYVVGTMDGCHLKTKLLQGDSNWHETSEELATFNHKSCNAPGVTFALALSASSGRPTSWNWTASLASKVFERSARVAVDRTLTLGVFVARDDKNDGSPYTNLVRITQLDKTTAEKSNEILIEGASIKDMIFVTGGSYVAVVLETSQEDLTFNVTSYNGALPNSTSGTLASGLPASCSIIMALRFTSNSKPFEPAWMVTAPSDELQLNAITEDADSGMFFVGTILKETQLSHYTANGYETFTAEKSQPKRYSAIGSSDVFVGHILARTETFWSPAFQPSIIGGDEEDFGHDIDYNRNGDHGGTLMLGAAIKGKSREKNIPTFGNNMQSVLVSVNPVNGSANYAAVIAGGTDQVHSLSVSALPRSANGPEAVMTGAFADAISYRSITMQARGATDSFILPAT